MKNALRPFTSRVLLRRMGTPKEQLWVHSRNDLKSELGRMFPEPQFRPLLSLLFTFVEHSFVVWFSRA